MYFFMIVVPLYLAPLKTLVTELTVGENRKELWGNITWVQITFFSYFAPKKFLQLFCFSQPRNAGSYWRTQRNHKRYRFHRILERTLQRRLGCWTWTHQSVRRATKKSDTQVSVIVLLLWLSGLLLLCVLICRCVGKEIYGIIRKFIENLKEVSFFLIFHQLKIEYFFIRLPSIYKLCLFLTA